jgi:hypothetical protein
MPWNIINSVKTVASTQKLTERSWVAVGNDSTGRRLATSTNGKVWTTITGFNTDFWQDVAYGNDSSSNGLWIVAGSNPLNGNCLIKSSNRTTWTGVVSPLTAEAHGVAYGIDGSGTGLWVAVGTGGNSVIRSTNGTNWTNASTNVFTTGGKKVAYGKDTSNNGLWIAVGDGNKIVRSTDGNVWSVTTQSILTDIRSVRYGKDGSGTGLWLAVGGNNTGNTIISSSNGGRNWNAGGTGTINAYAKDVFYGNNLWILAGQTSSNTKPLATSINGSTWTSVPTPRLTDADGITYGKDSSGNGLWVATGIGTSGNCFATSQDGTTWTEIGQNNIFNVSGYRSAFSEIIAPP